MSEKTGPLMDVTAIEAILPHRYPFLLVDRVISIDTGKTLVAVKGVTVNEPHFAGHFPGHPVMPGVLILEALAQAGGLLVKASLSEDTSDKVTYLMAIDNARFRRPVVPGDQLELHVEVVKQKGAIWKTRGQARVDGEVVAEADYMAMLVDRKKEG
jgi:3-hydroxyacyl-[acyl-carrier-protein] dehydratase